MPNARDIKPRPNDRRYVGVLRRMSPEARLRKAMDLSALTKALFREGLRRRFPESSPEELHDIYLDRLKKCHKQGY
ncbi:MAG: hypothetical protein MI757_15030 [Pirellulales bacterium]|nr:hypothetical protein [Pirellulales bacterium]